MEGEIVRFGLLQDPHNRSGRDNTMKGITSNKETTTVKVVDLKIDEEFYFEVIKDSIEEEFGIEVDRLGYFIIETGIMKQKFNLKELVVELLHIASKKTINTVYRIDGKTLLEDIKIDIPSLPAVRNRSRRNGKKSTKKEG